VLTRFFSISIVLHFLLVSIDRFIAVVHAMRYRSLVTKRRALHSLLAGLATAIFVAMIQFSWIGFNVNVNEDSETNTRRVNVMYDSVCIVVFFVVPLIAMIFCYVRIFAVLRQQLDAIKQNNTMSTTREERLSYRRKRRATLIFIGMITMSVYHLLASLLSAQLSARVWKRIFHVIHFS